MRKVLPFAAVIVGLLWGALNFIGTLQTARGIYEDRGALINTIVLIITAPSPLIPAGVFAAGVLALVGLRLGWFDGKSEAEPQEVFVAIDQLKTLLAEGTAMETTFQIVRQANPKHAAIHAWIGRVNTCARQKALTGLVGPKEIKNFNTPWHPKDVERVEALLAQAGHFNGVDEVGRLSFRTIWGHVKRLEELIATIEGTQVVAKCEIELHHERIKRADTNVGTINRRAAEVEAAINGNLAALGMMNALRVEFTKELMGAVSGGPSPIVPIEEELINDAYEIDRELTWQAYRDLGIAVGSLNMGIAKHNETPTLPFCHELLRRVEVIRKLVVDIARERVQRSTSSDLS
ncbi:MAG: hypothetical protein V7609_3377 [Verrucomicrobiota bacterium]